MATVDKCKCEYCKQQADIRAFSENSKTAKTGNNEYYIYCPHCGANTRFKRGSDGQKSLQSRYNKKAKIPETLKAEAGPDLVENPLTEEKKPKPVNASPQPAGDNPRGVFDWLSEGF